MKKIKFSLLGILVMLVLSFSFIGCENNKDATGTSTVMVRLTDAPGDYEEVNIEVVDVLMKTSLDTDDSKGWVSLGDIGKGTYNLLDLTGGVNVLIAEDQVPSGYIGQLRLVLGTNNTIKKEGVVYELNTPSAQQSGLKLKINQNLVAGATYEFTMDFDVDKSIVKAGNSGIYNLKPVINISTVATSGLIKGAINPVLEGYQVMASVVVGDVVISAYANEQGLFQLNGIPAGTYTVTITPDVASGKSVKIIENVIVNNGIATNLGDIVL